MRSKVKTRTELKKERVQLEKQFLNCVIDYMNNYYDLRQVCTEEFKITWRQFIDKRHQAFWRILQTLDISKPPEERLEIVIKESGEIVEKDFAEDSARMKEFEKQAGVESWIFRELKAADVLSLVGGLVYLQEIFASGIGSQLFAKQLAEKLF